MNILEHPNIVIEMEYVEFISNFYIYNKSFNCNYDQLTSLYGSPIIVLNGDFDCSGNKLKTLKYCPEYVTGYFDCSNNKLETLKYCPKYVGGNFYCDYNKIKFTEEYVRSLCDVKGKVYC